MQEGCTVLIGDINEFGAEILAGKLAKYGTVASTKMDVTSEADWKQAVDLCVNALRGLDIVVNNAGTTYKNKVCSIILLVSAGGDG
jgi:3-oxoacyl-[acyl-carrier protein] reductase